MTLPSPNISDARRAIRPLDDAAINRIAAGEVVERPASAVKELVENALDAGASRVEVAMAEGGKTLIRVTDDGCGIPAAELPLALARHATSKIDGTDLLAIHTFGFRGEALASLAAVARLSVTSRVVGEQAHAITAEAGRIRPVRPAALTRGTVVELRDLFFATPARLKFLRTDRAEAQAIADTLRRLAIAEPAVGFALIDCTGGETREMFRVEPERGGAALALKARLRAVLGGDFADNAVPLAAERDGLALAGFAALPTYSRGAAVAQHVFVNGRPVRDKLLLGALRAGYMDVLARDRHPAAALFVACDPHLVDVNVHPAKAEVRFRDPGAARALVVTGLRAALGQAPRAATTMAAATLEAFRAEAPRIYQMDRPAPRPAAPPAPRGFAEPGALSARIFAPEPEAPEGPLGAARAQLHGNYIIAQTGTGIVIVDQHAAHERLVYERLKRQMEETGVASQALLIPEIVELPPADAQRLLDHAGDLARLGLHLEAFGAGAVAVRETPAVLGPVDARALVRDILDELADMGASETLRTRMHAILSRIACHGSVRSGRQMRAEEMNALLRDMEATPNAGQCNHGRPTFVELRLSDIERLFGRT
jgi:DNA mismatch repair protein MutL